MIPSVFMADARTFKDAMHTSLLSSPTPLSSNFGSLDGSAPDFERTGRPLQHSAPGKMKSTRCPYNVRKCHYSWTAYPGSKITSIRPPSQWPLLRVKLQVLNQLLAATPPQCGAILRFLREPIEFVTLLRNETT